MATKRGLPKNRRGRRMTAKQAITALGDEIKTLRELRKADTGTIENLRGEVQRALDQYAALRDVPLFVNHTNDGMRMPLQYFTLPALLNLLHALEQEHARTFRVLGNDGAMRSEQRELSPSVHLIVDELVKRGFPRVSGDRRVRHEEAHG